MEALVRSSKMIFFGQSLSHSPPRTLLGRSGFNFPRSPIYSNNNVRFIRSISLQNKATSNLSYQTEVLTGSEIGSNVMQGSQALKTVHVRFQLQKECSYGEEFMLVGDHPMIGSWDPSRAKALNWSDGHIWTVELDMPVDLPVQFKFVLKQSEEDLVWQPGADRIVRTWNTSNTIVIAEDWENAEFQKISEDKTRSQNMNQGLNIGLEPIVVPMVNNDSMFGNNVVTDNYKDGSQNVMNASIEPSGVDGIIGMNSNIGVSLGDEKVSHETHAKGGPVLIPGLSPLQMQSGIEETPSMMTDEDDA